MNNKYKNRELLSRRDFFRKAAINTLPFIAAIAVPPIFTSCSPEPTPTPSGCDGCSSTCEGSCDNSCSGSCEGSCAGSSSNSGSSCSDCSYTCKNTCSSTCSDSCKGTSTGENKIEFTGVDLGLSVLWATFDIGSTSSDTYPQKYYWGDGTGKATNEDMITLINNKFPFKEDTEYNITGTEYDLAHKSIGNDWRLPTETELIELVTLCTATHEFQNGVSILKFEGPNGKSIFIPGDKDNNIHRFCSCIKCNKNESGSKNRTVSVINYKWGLTSIGQSLLLDDENVLYMPIRPVKNGGSGCKECSSGCTTTCTTTCSTNCVGNCKDTCKGECKNGCGNECSENCSSGCQTGCKEGCKEECKGGCYTGCKNGSKNSSGSGSSGGNSTSGCATCENTCNSGCGEQCYYSCGGTCSNNCQGGCRFSCIGWSMSVKNCSSSCYGSCNNNCDNTCKSFCYTSCQNVGKQS